jgi:hypothetical protein
VLKTCHTGEEHAAKKNIDGCPKTGGSEVEVGVFHPADILGELDANDGGNGLENDEQNVEISIDKVVVAGQCVMEMSIAK